MLNQHYQAWAKLARDLQAATGRWNLAALFCVVVAALSAQRRLYSPLVAA